MSILMGKETKYQFVFNCLSSMIPPGLSAEEAKKNKQFL